MSVSPSLHYLSLWHTQTCNALFIILCYWRDGVLYYEWLRLVQCGIMQNMVEVRVPNLDCEGCASKLKKALFKLKGTFCIRKRNQDVFLSFTHGPQEHILGMIWTCCFWIPKSCCLHFTFLNIIHGPWSSDLVLLWCLVVKSGRASLEVRWKIVELGCYVKLSALWLFIPYRIISLK